MAFSVMASSSSALSSRVANNNNALRKQTVSRKSASAFSCRAMSEAEIDAKYPVGGSVYKVRICRRRPRFFYLGSHLSVEKWYAFGNRYHKRERAGLKTYHLWYTHALTKFSNWMDRRGEKSFEIRLFFLISLSLSLSLSLKTLQNERTLTVIILIRKK